MGEKKRIGILTSGGDAPGMNAAIRASVRTALDLGYEVYGINRGYAGLLDKDFQPMNSNMVAEILGTGGTILRTSRSEFFPTSAGLKRATEILEEYHIDTLIVIGGDGSLTGALMLTRLGVKVVGMPGTIDNDFGASDYTIGFDTAVSTAIDAISKIRDTTFSHNRINIVQVMGRSCGDIALYSGFASAAEALIIPEKENNLEEICAELLHGRDRGHLHSIVMLAEGCGSYRDYLKRFEELTQVTTKGTNLGYIQRGGSPTHFDRNLASYMGYKAVEAIEQGNLNTVIVQQKGEYIAMPIEDALAAPKVFNEEMYDIMKILAK
ncbi:MAG: ATP-dependent 6-phosphofructokinase [Eubacteriaceae bacterium]|jgi:6-phosphofructokinase 1